VTATITPLRIGLHRDRYVLFELAEATVVIRSQTSNISVTGLFSFSNIQEMRQLRRLTTVGWQNAAQELQIKLSYCQLTFELLVAAVENLLFVRAWPSRFPAILALASASSRSCRILRYLTRLMAAISS
jgi:hypothetical protein